MASLSKLLLEPGPIYITASDKAASHRSCRLAPRSVSVSSFRIEAKESWSSDGAGHVNISVKDFDVPILSGTQVVEMLRVFEQKRFRKPSNVAMYSSIFGGITTDLAAMVVPLDDHMVHRGHGVFDTAAIMDGYLYELDQHLDRFLRSASMAKINLPFVRSQLRNILIQTVSASKCTEGALRYWLSAGPGDFYLTPSGCLQSALYAVAYETHLPEFKGSKVVTSSIPIKSKQFAIMKSVNYLPNVLSKMEAEENGAFAGIWLDDEGYVAEGPNMNVAFLTEERELLMPEFDKILSGCTARRVLVLAEKLVKEGKIKGVRVGKVTIKEGKMANEMMLIGSGILVKPVVQWDERIIGDDADWAGDPVSRKSTSGFCSFLGDTLISWTVKKQHTVARSSTKSEYRALAALTSDIIWLRRLLTDFGIIHDQPTDLFCDNTSAIALANNPVFHARTKHIEIDQRFLRDHIQQNNIRLLPFSTIDQIADIFTKSLSTPQFQQLRLKLTVTQDPSVCRGILASQDL